MKVENSIKIKAICPICGADLYGIAKLTDGQREYCANNATHIFEVGRRIPGRALINRSGQVIERFLI